MAIKRDVARATKAANKATQPPRLKVIIMPVPQIIREIEANICSVLFLELITRAMVKINKTDRKAAKILGSVIIPQHLVLKSAFEAGSSQVLGIAGASMYSQIAIRPCKKPVKEAIL